MNFAARLIVMAVTACLASLFFQNPLQIGARDGLLIIDVQNDFLPERPVRDSKPLYPIPDKELSGDKKSILAGSLGVTDGDKIVDVCSSWASAFDRAGAKVFLSLDWHTDEHCSFCRNPDPLPKPGDKLLCTQDENPKSLTTRCEDPVSKADYDAGRLVQWRDHCVHGSFGARVDPYLVLPNSTVVVKKGFVKHLDSYSAFGGRRSHTMEDTESEQTLSGQDDLSSLLEANHIERLWVVGLATDFCVRQSTLDALGKNPHSPNRPPRGLAEVVLVRAGVRGVIPALTKNALADIVAGGARVLEENRRSPPSGAAGLLVPRAVDDVSPVQWGVLAVCALVFVFVRFV